MQHHAGDVRVFAQRWIADDVHVRETGDAQRVAQSRAARAFHIGQNFKLAADLEAGVKRFDARSGVFTFGQKAVWAEIFRIESRILLADEVALYREPEAAPKGLRIARLREDRTRRKKQQQKENSQRSTMVGHILRCCQQPSTRCVDYS